MLYITVLPDFLTSFHLFKGFIDCIYAAFVIVVLPYGVIKNNDNNNNNNSKHSPPLKQILIFINA